MSPRLTGVMRIPAVASVATTVRSAIELSISNRLGRDRQKGPRSRTRQTLPCPVATSMTKTSVCSSPSLSPSTSRVTSLLRHLIYALWSFLAAVWWKSRGSFQPDAQRSADRRAMVCRAAQIIRIPSAVASRSRKVRQFQLAWSRLRESA